MKAQVGKFTLCGDGLCVGYDSADAVSKEIQTENPTNPFTGGTIEKVVITPREDHRSARGWSRERSPQTEGDLARGTRHGSFSWRVREVAWGISDRGDKSIFSDLCSSRHQRRIVDHVSKYEHGPSAILDGEGRGQWPNHMLSRR